MARKKTILKDRFFFNLWNKALESISFKEYYNKITSTFSEDFVDFKKYNLTVDQIYGLLYQVYQIKEISLKDIFNEYGFTNASFSNRYCIPKRTVENWIKGVNSMPPYVKLLILSDLKKQILPPGYVLESWIESKGKLEEPLSENKLDDIDTKLAEIDKRLSAIHTRSIK